MRLENVTTFHSKEGKMIEKLIRWAIRTFLKDKHLHSNPKTAAVVDFPKEVKDAERP